jgi:hypothetical protein
MGCTKLIKAATFIFDVPFTFNFGLFKGDCGG